MERKGPEILRFFLSYAHEDFDIANAVCKALKDALGDTFAEVYLDKTSLKAGSDFSAQIEEQLDHTNVFIIVYTGRVKPSHAYPGWEVGYFRRVQKRSEELKGPMRRIVPFYLDSPPATASAMQGISFGISAETLRKSEGMFVAEFIQTVDSGHPAVQFLDQLQTEVEQIRTSSGFCKPSRVDSVKCAKDMLTTVFRSLKMTVDETLRPQKQLVIRTNSDSLAAVSDDLPPNAQISSEGSGGVLNLFGLPEIPLTWQEFTTKIADHKLGAAWRDAITIVVGSALGPQINIDNSQVIISSDDKHAYRLILTSSTSYYDGKREFHLYFVEALRRRDFGNKVTTLLLKGLEIVCRFRFMFLEEYSEFSPQNVLLAKADVLIELARALLRELNHFRRDAQAAGLDQPNVWGELVTWDVVVKMSQAWGPYDENLRRTTAGIIVLKRDAGAGEQLKRLQAELSDLLGLMAPSIRPFNDMLIDEMATKLRQAVNLKASIESAKPLVIRPMATPMLVGES